MNDKANNQNPPSGYLGENDKMIKMIKKKKGQKLLGRRGSSWKEEELREKLKGVKRLLERGEQGGLWKG